MHKRIDACSHVCIYMRDIGSPAMPTWIRIDDHLREGYIGSYPAGMGVTHALEAAADEWGYASFHAWAKSRDLTDAEFEDTLTIKLVP